MEEAASLLLKAISELINPQGDCEACVKGSRKLRELAWDSLQTNKRWKHVAWRECMIFGCVIFLGTYLRKGATAPNDRVEFEEIVRTLDLAFIFGCPPALLQPIEQLLNSQEESRKKREGGEVGSPSGPEKWEIQMKKQEGPPAPSCDQNPIPEAVEFSMENHLKKGCPVLLRGAAQSWKPKWTCLQKWKDLKYFLRKYGHRFVPIELGVSSSPNFSEKVMRMSEFIENYLVESNKGVSLKQVGYLAQHKLFDQLSGLKDDFGLPPYFTASDVERINAWIGTSGTITPLHYDSYNNFFVQVQGTKYVRLYSPEETPKLYVIESAAAEKDSKQSSLSTAQGNISAVCCEREDFNVHPLAKEAHYVHAVLQPGDCLFIPAGMWHYVRSTSCSMSLNFWLNPPPKEGADLG
eukprot:CAMPEP_0201489020 /NCGR_PEP_ID=MMETSP0151_2-20130828/20975_1 /ASSEMBLY_ACC=CAM_ASM_000257 /TAXON_ID=200890 /ORGANISM="Paramoeba atlantica, Strain 621/1 / CCAP 1560/9" /LENGTH=407 /DNA_ID=CAMNT_0047874483 /DNA_START=198 /DNA_END=1421 /DNA_ORIENTATION=-